MSTIVSLHAHPDDEALLTGGWIAQRAAAGDRVVLVFATDGGAGLTSTACAGTHAGDATALARRRRDEAAASARELGAARVVWLGYADSGMTGAPTTSPARFANTSADEVARIVAAILDEEDADVLTGYDARGGYGHPDHVQVHRLARVAQNLAARRPRLLEATLDRTSIVRALRVLRPFTPLLPGLTLPADDVYTDRTELSLAVDVRDQLAAKRAALSAHCTQTSGGVRTIALLLALPRPLARCVLGTEWFIEIA